MNFYIQYALTILTIALIPTLLWWGKNHNAARYTYITFATLIVADVTAYFAMTQHPSYIYLAVITALAILLVKRRKT